MKKLAIKLKDIPSDVYKDYYQAISESGWLDCKVKEFIFQLKKYDALEELKSPLRENSWWGKLIGYIDNLFGRKRPKTDSLNLFHDGIEYGYKAGFATRKKFLASDPEAARKVLEFCEKEHIELIPRGLDEIAIVYKCKSDEKLKEVEYYWEDDVLPEELLKEVNESENSDK